MTQEQLGIQYVTRYEKAHRRKAVNVSREYKGYDVKSGNRYIEVKSRYKSEIQPFITLNKTLLRTLGKKLVNYYVYAVYDMKRKPKLVIIPPDDIFKNLETDVSLKIRGKVYNKNKPEILKLIKNKK